MALKNIKNIKRDGVALFCGFNVFHSSLVWLVGGLPCRPVLRYRRAHIKITLNCLSCHADWQTSKQETIRILLIGVVV